MAKKNQIVKQWLETEAAFGVSEVPVAKQRPGKKGSVKGVPAGQTAAVKVVVAAVAQAGPVKRAPAARPETAERPPQPSTAEHDAAARPVRPATTRAAAKAGANIPLAPAGNISDLPAITRTEKEKRMAALLAETTAALTPYLDEVATRVVFGEGDVDAPVMFIGEGPGIDEDRTGRPFVGRAGQYLDKWIVAMTFAREQVYIANVVKLRAASPSEEWGGKLKDRPPTPEEVARNIVFLHKQIEIVRPKVIVTLGAPALRHITGSTEGITKIRGTWLSYRGTDVMPTLHPSFVLRNLGDTEASKAIRRNVWEDLQAVMAKIGKTDRKQ